jgi:hypothetical protein
MRYLAGIALLFASLSVLSAQAQSLPPERSETYANCSGGAAPPPVFARQTYSGLGTLRMECLRRWSPVAGPTRFPTATVDLSQDEREMGFAVTGGGCQQIQIAGQPDQCNNAMIVGRPVGDAGWVCQSGDVPNDQSQTQKRVQAYLVACRVAANPAPIGPIETIATNNDGAAIAVARRARTVERPLPHDLRLCNVSDFPFNVRFGGRDDGAVRARSLTPQQCLEVARPRWVDIAGDAGQPARAGTMQWFEPGFFDPNGAPTYRSAAAPPQTPPFGDWQAQRADRCDATPQDWPSRRAYTYRCRQSEPLPRGDYRVCFDAANVETKDGRTVWAESALRTTTSRRLARNATGDWQLEVTSAAPGTCMDVFGLTHITFLLRRAPDNDNYWDPAKVNAVIFRVQRMEAVQPARRVTSR